MPPTKSQKSKTSKVSIKKKVTLKTNAKKKSKKKISRIPIAKSKASLKVDRPEKLFKLKAASLKITVSATGQQSFCLKNFLGQKVVLYFYPKDLTPGCTVEGQDFNSLYNKFKNSNTVILGVSRDTVSLHERFKEKYGFKFELLSDKDEKLCKAFDVIKLKKLYGREYLGVDRSTFVIDESGKIIQQWRGVKVKGHAKEVLEFIKAIG